MRTSRFRFYEELNDFLPKELHKKSFNYSFTGKPSMKNTIEAIGVPHVEIDLILVDGTSVDFDFLLMGEEDISVYPIFESFDISPVVRLRPEPLRETRFVVDVNLGKLAQKLRLLGFDTLYRNDFEDDEIVRISVLENRIILTRDKGVLKHTNATHGYWVRNYDPLKQLQEVIDRLQLQHRFSPFSRCSKCNGKLINTKKVDLQDQLQNDTINAFEKFWRCNGCGNIYWQGSHYDKICDWVEKMGVGNNNHK